MKRVFSFSVVLLALATMGAAQTWVDVTSQCVTNPDYNGNANGWTYSYVRSDGSVGYTNHCFRFFGAEDGEIYQNITVPEAGKYRVSLQAFNRVGNFNAAHGENEENPAYMYANDIQQTLHGLYDYQRTTAYSSGTSKQDNAGYYYPDNSGSAYQAFSEGAYRNELEVTVGDDRQLTIGVNVGEYVYNSWLVMTNWKVEQLREPQERTWTAPVMPERPTTFEGGTLESGAHYYIYNMGADQFLTTGGVWGTQACLGDTPMEVMIEDATYYYGYEGFFIRPQQAMRHKDEGWIYSSSYRFFRDDTSAYGDWRGSSSSSPGVLSIEQQTNGNYRIRAAADCPRYGMYGTNINDYDNEWFGRVLALNHDEDSTVNSNLPATSGNAVEWALVNVATDSWALARVVYRARVSLYALLEEAFAENCPVGEADDTYNNAEATPEELYAAYETLYSDLKAYRLQQLMAGASAANPVDITSYCLVNADMSQDCRNGVIPDGWTITVWGQNVGGRKASYTSGGVQIYNFIEVWHPSSSLGDGIIAQTIYDDLPEGKYTLEADILTNVGVSGIYLFIGHDEENEERTACSSDQNNQPKHYAVTYIHDGNGPLTVGVRVASTSSTWLAADNFRFLYYGNEVNQKLVELENRVNNYSEALNNYCNTEVANTFTAAMNDARAMIARGTASDSEIAAMQSTLTAAYEAVIASTQDYANLATAISQLWDIYRTTVNYTSDEWVTLANNTYDAYYTAEMAYENHTATEATLATAQQQYNTLKAELDRLIKEKEEGGDEIGEWIDITSDYLRNPGFDNNTTEEWSVTGRINGQGANNHEMEFWQSGPAEIIQALTAPFDGKYRLSVQGFYRPGANNINAINAYKNGTDSQRNNCYIFANEQQTPMTSIYAHYRESEGYYYEYNNGNTSFSGGLGDHYVALLEKGQAIYSGYSYTEYEATLANYPNTMLTGQSLFEEGCYADNSVTVTLHKGDRLQLGLRIDNYASDNWTLFDNFRLEWLGTEVLATEIRLNATTLDLIVGEEAQLTAMVLPTDATFTKVVYTSSNESVATVDADGLITTKAEGKATITARMANGSSEASATCTVIVTRGTVTAEALIINEVQAANVDMYLDPSFNYGAWVELYNSTDKAVTLEGLYISDDAKNLKKHRMDSRFGIVPAKGYKVLWFDHHSRFAPTNINFNLDCDGSDLYISNEAGQVITELTYPMAISRCSYARATDGSDIWRYTDEPTPGATNATSTFGSDRLDPPTVDVESGVFEDGERVRVNVTFPQGATLLYTLDGTAPSRAHYNGIVSTSNSYSFEFTSNSVLRLRLFQEGMLSSPVVTRSFLFRTRNYSLPILNIVADNEDIQGADHGILVRGNGNGIPGNGQDGPCNWNADWERPVQMEYFTADGKLAFSQEVGMEASGGWSRAWAPHSSNFKAKKQYEGENKMAYAFFADRPNVRYKSVKLRNGGNEYNSGRVKDAVLQTIVRSSGLYVETQGFQPVHQFFNGSYIGVLNLREPNSKHYGYTVYGLDNDNMDQFKMTPDSGYVQQAGTRDAWEQLLALSQNASDEDSYAEIEKLVDIEEYINYLVVEFYLASTDYPQNNIKGFRDRNDGRFRFVLFDIDFAFDSSNPFDNFANKQIYTFNALRGSGDNFNTGDRWTLEIEFVTLFLNMMKNEQFRKRFIDAYAVITGSVFEPNRCRDIANEIANIVNPALRVGGETTFSTSKITNNLTSNLQTSRINQLVTFLNNRYDGATTQQTVTLASEMEQGRLMVNDMPVPTNTFSGKLFYPVTVKAIAPTGYTFNGWKNQNGTVVSRNASYDLNEGQTFNLTATFKKTAAAQLAKTDYHPIKINEVCANESGMYINDLGSKADWFELYNTTDQDYDIAGLYAGNSLTEPKKMRFEAKNGISTIIPAHGHTIVWADNKSGLSQLHANFKLTNKDSCVVVITAADESWADTLVYHAHTEQQTIGLYPDGASTLYTFDLPTLNRANILSYYAQLYEEFVIKPGESVGIDELNEDDFDDNDAVYDLSGRKVCSKNQFGTLPRGIYIVNGRKVLR